MSAGIRSIVLIGFMGAGKSAAGQELARTLKWPCLETDELVAAKFGLTIPEIFEKFGETRFRDSESAVLEQIEPGAPAVIVSGGGVVLRPENVRRLRELGSIVWLRTDLDVLRARLRGGKDRPLLQTADPSATMETLLAQRQPLYEQAADRVIDTSRLRPSEVVAAICDGIQISP